jgi:thiamine pyrophosphate-dependent acetolactate synthase large subunit-like protein
MRQQAGTFYHEHAVPTALPCTYLPCLTPQTDVLKRYEAYGWHVQTVDDVNDLQAVRSAIQAAKAETGKPSIIKVRNSPARWCVFVVILLWRYGLYCSWW